MFPIKKLQKKKNLFDKSYSHFVYSKKKEILVKKEGDWTMSKDKKIQKVIEPMIWQQDIQTFSVIGDPGCEGLGTYNMKIYAGALEKSAKSDFTLIVGDMVPDGSKKYYNEIQEITELIAHNPVYVLRGNHDTGDYEKHFGRHNYAIIAKDFAVIAIDNAMRTFEEEGLELIKQVLAMEEVKNVVLSFNIPVPNHFIENCVSEEEFTRLKEAYMPFKEKVKYLLCGHVHSCFVDEVDGIPLICTGGGGAMIEDVSEEIKASDVNHHIVYFYMEEGTLKYQFEDINETCYQREQEDAILKEKLEEAVKGEMMAHLRYLTFADRARKRGMNKIANLFEALADSEYRHARNFYAVLDQPPAFTATIKDFIPVEQFEYEQLYKMMQQYARENHAPLTRQAYENASSAERVHAELLEESMKMEQFEHDTIYVCPVCGFIMTEESALDRCIVCGAPARQFHKFQAE